MTFATDVQAMCRGIMGTDVIGPDGPLRGIWETYDKEVPWQRVLPRFASEMERFVILTIATADQGTIVRRSTVTQAGISYVVREILLLEDGLETEIYLVAVSP